MAGKYENLPDVVLPELESDRSLISTTTSSPSEKRKIQSSKLLTVRKLSKGCEYHKLDLMCVIAITIACVTAELAQT